MASTPVENAPLGEKSKNGGATRHENGTQQQEQDRSAKRRVPLQSSSKTETCVERAAGRQARWRLVRGAFSAVGVPVNS